MLYRNLLRRQTRARDTRLPRYWVTGRRNKCEKEELDPRINSSGHGLQVPLIGKVRLEMLPWVLLVVA